MCVCVCVCVCVSFAISFRHQLILGCHKFLRTKLTCTIHLRGFPNCGQLIGDIWSKWLKRGLQLQNQHLRGKTVEEWWT